MTIPNKLFLDRIGQHELELLDAFDSNDSMEDAVRFFILEWHRRAHKTTLALNLLNRECCKHPKSKYVYIAPTQVWARNVVWDDPTMLWDTLPDKAEMGWGANGQKMLITYQNGSMLKIGGSDEPDSLRGIDADGEVFDEWALHKPEIWTQIFRPINAGAPKVGHRPRWAMFLYTPKGLNHATQMFNVAACIESEALLPNNGRAVKCKPGWFASRLDAHVSGIIPDIELKTMQQEVTDGLLTKEEYDQEMRCRRVTEEERTLITSAQLDRLNSVFVAPKAEAVSYKIVAIDPAFGGDLCAIKGFENNEVVIKRNVHYTLTSEVCGEAKNVAKELGTKDFIVDCIGVGKGVADGLNEDEAEYRVQYFNSASKSEDERFANLKAEAVYYVAQKIRKIKVNPIKNPELRRQLVALSRYKVQESSGKMIMRPNDEVKKDIGCSPDEGLCYVYGIWGLRRVRREVGLTKSRIFANISHKPYVAKPGRGLKAIA